MRENRGHFMILDRSPRVFDPDIRATFTREFQPFTQQFTPPIKLSFWGHFGGLPLHDDYRGEYTHVPWEYGHVDT